MGSTWLTWHCEKCQIVLPWKDGMENLKCVGCEMKAENAKLRDQLRWRDAYGEPPTEEGIYLVINNDFDGGTSIHATYWKGKWPIGFTVPYWRPIGPLPKEGE